MLWEVVKEGDKPNVKVSVVAGEGTTFVNGIKLPKGQSQVLRWFDRVVIGNEVPPPPQRPAFDPTFSIGKGAYRSCRTHHSAVAQSLISRGIVPGSPGLKVCREGKKGRERDAHGCCANSAKTLASSPNASGGREAWSCISAAACESPASRSCIPCTSSSSRSRRRSRQ